MGTRNRILIYLNCAVLALHSILIFAISTVPVFALSSSGLQSTIASIIVSLMLQTGVAPVNNAWLTALNNSYGVESSIGTIGNAIESGLLTETANGLIDTGLSDAIMAQTAYTDLGLAEIFSTTVDDVGVVTGSGAVNLAESACNVGWLGNLGAFAGAAGIGIGAGILANHLREAVVDFIRSGAKITYNKDVIQACPDDSTCIYTTYGASGSVKYNTIYYYVPNTATTCAVPGQYMISVEGVSLTNSSESLPVHVYRDKDNIANFRKSIGTSPGNLYQYGYVGNWGVPDCNAVIFQTQQEATNYLNACRQDPSNIIRPYSPDLIGNNGNHQATYNPETGKYEDNHIGNVVPEGYDMVPVDMDDYQDFVEEANDNTENGETGLPQATIFDNLIDSLLQEQSMVPDQGVDIPTVPDRPIIPEQPDQPPKDPISDQEQEAINAGLANTELANVFPFCIPFDIYAIFGNLKAGREAPVLIYEFPEQFGWGAIEIDLSPYEEVAKILRTMELLLFIIGLAINTRPLIGAL